MYASVGQGRHRYVGRVETDGLRDEGFEDVDGRDWRLCHGGLIFDALESPDCGRLFLT